MPVSARRMVTMFSMIYDRGITSRDKDLSIEMRCALLTSAENAVHEELVKRSEMSDRYRRVLLPFEMKHVNPAISNGGNGYVVASFPKDCKKVQRRSVTISKSSCGTKKIGCTIVQKNDLDAMLNHAHWRPSYKWEVCLTDEGMDGMYFYHGNDYSIDSVEIDYIRKPIGINAPSMVEDDAPYTNIDGESVAADTPCSFDDEYIADLIVRLAALGAESNLTNMADYQAQVRFIADQIGLSNL